MHNHDIVSVHFNHFNCTEICDKIRRNLSMFTYIWYPKSIILWSRDLSIVVSWSHSLVVSWSRSCGFLISWGWPFVDFNFYDNYFVFWNSHSKSKTPQDHETKRLWVHGHESMRPQDHEMTRPWDHKAIRAWEHETVRPWNDRLRWSWMFLLTQ